MDENHVGENFPERGERQSMFQVIFDLGRDYAIKLGECSRPYSDESKLYELGLAEEDLREGEIVGFDGVYVGYYEGSDDGVQPSKVTYNFHKGGDHEEETEYEVIIGQTGEASQAIDGRTQGNIGKLLSLLYKRSNLS